MRSPSAPATPAVPHVGAALDPGWRACVPAAWLEGWRPEPFALDGGTTEVVAMGAGEPIVLVPPLPGYKEAWLAVAASLARSHRVVAFDLRSRFGARPSWDAMLRDFERLLDAYAPGAATIVGHSLGGALAQRWALARPDRVRALVLSSTFAKVTNPPGNLYARFIEQPLLIAAQRLLPDAPARALARTMARHGRWVYDTRCDDAMLAFVRHCMRHTTAATAGSAIALAAAHDTRATVARIAAPTLVLVGEREPAFYPPAARELARTIPGAELRVSPGASHLHPLTNPQWFVETVEEWLATLPAR